MIEEFLFNLFLISGFAAFILCIFLSHEVIKLKRIIKELTELFNK